MNLVNQDLKKREEEVDAWTTWDTKLIIKIKIKMHEDPRTKMHGLKCAFCTSILSGELRASRTLVSFFVGRHSTETKPTTMYDGAIKELCY